MNVDKFRERECHADQFKDYMVFRDSFVEVQELGSGGDGNVEAWQHRLSGNAIAVKYPRTCLEREVSKIEEEAKILQTLGKHPHIVEYLGECPNFRADLYAIALEYCELGTLLEYRAALCSQEDHISKISHVPGAVIWKLLRDMSLALDFLHNYHSRSYIHNGFKPDNILVKITREHNRGNGGTGCKPTFKLADFARLVPYHRELARIHPTYWNGIPEYAPPLAEQYVPLTPAADIWSLGCTIQSFALGVLPVESRVSCKTIPVNIGHILPEINDSMGLKETNARLCRSTIYRPLHMTKMDLQTYWDVHEDLLGYDPYSWPLGSIYRQLFEVNASKRPDSRFLVQVGVPYFEQQIEIFQEIALQRQGLMCKFVSLRAVRYNYHRIRGSSHQEAAPRLWKWTKDCESIQYEDSDEQLDNDNRKKAMVSMTAVVRISISELKPVTRLL